MSQSIPLHAIELTGFIARGGMGSVWAGTDRRSGLEVAVKIINPDAAEDPEAIEAFRSEARSVARLRHPGIVSVYDYGAVTDAAAAASDGALVAGSPYLTMERVDGPSLKDLERRLEWPEILAMARQILAALAHTHARDIVHRDLKPGNVLVGEAAFKVSDFGIAHALDTHGDTWKREIAKGTPGYMAPEQRRNRWRDFGPWTDLYALGRMLADRVAGVEAPAGLAGWLARMVAADPDERFQRAADAAFALEALDGEPTALVLSGDELGADTPTEVTAVGFEPEIDAGPAATGPMAIAAPPVPDDWRRASRGDDPRLRGAGIGLFGLRARPVIAREAERDALWAELRRACDGGGPRAVVLRGGTGVGKSRLARWIAELAHEVGAAETLRASLGPAPHREHGLGAMLARFFRCGDLGRAETVSVLTAKLRRLGFDDPMLWLALAELIAPDPDRAIDLGDEPARHHLVLTVIERLAGRRPVVVWLDDADRDPAALAFVRRLIQRPARRVLAVVTVAEEAVAGETRAGVELAALEALAPVTRLRVGPLEPIDHQRLVRGLLGLEDSLAVRVEALTAGNPLFAEHVVGDLIGRDRLEPAPGGRWRLVSGSELALPDDLRALWNARLATFDDGDDLEALERAAALDAEVDTEEWRWACALTGLRPSPRLVERLAERGLVDIRAGGGSWAFANSMLRDCLERRARDAGRFADHHRACAELIASHGGPLADERVALHWLAAGDRETAVGPLYAAAARRTHRGEFRSARRLLAERDAALEHLDVSDDRRARGWLLHAKCTRAAGDLDGAVTWAERVLDAECAPKVRCEALLVLTSIARLRGATDRALSLIAATMSEAESCADLTLIGKTHHERAWIHYNRGELADCITEFERAVDLLEPLLDRPGNVVAVTSSLNGISEAAVHLGDVAMARRALQRSFEIHERYPSMTHEAYTLSSLGEIERGSGDLDAAERAYLTALERLRAVGYGFYVYVELNLGLIELDRRRFDRARAWFERAIASFAHQGDGPAIGMAHAMLLPCLAAAGEWSRFDEHADQATARLGDGNLANADVAAPVQQAAALAAAAGETARARRAYQLARDQWRELGRGDQVAEIDARLNSLPPKGGGSGWGSIA